MIVRINLKPHGVEDGESAGQSKAENPCKIPHCAIVSRFFLISLIVIEVFSRHLAAHDAEDPTRIGNDEGHEKGGAEQHDKQGQMAA